MDALMRFSLLHPSRNRLQMAEAAIAEWTSKASGQHAIEYIVSIDRDDDDVEGYRALARRRGVKLLINNNRSLVDAVNRAAERSSGEVLIVVSDDFGCPQAWDEALAAIIGERRDVAVLVHDGVDGRIMTLPIIGRELYVDLGYVYHPAYFSMYVDDDLTAVALRLGKLIDARQLVFQHRHYTRIGTPIDATYARQNSGAAYLSGRRTFEKRRLADFDLTPRTPLIWVKQLLVDLAYHARMLASRAKHFVNALRRDGCHPRG
jgi:glycosyltransferase involved in cell wall biosynthesis